MFEKLMMDFEKLLVNREKRKQLRLRRKLEKKLMVAQTQEEKDRITHSLLLVDYLSAKDLKIYLK